MKPKFSKKIFPFSPGIPWTIKNNKYIIPGIDAKIWNKALDNKNFIISCYGGFLESFFSLSYCEAIAAIEPNRTLKWMGSPEFEKLANMQGLANINDFDLGNDTLGLYPVPIFMDADNNAYFNVLNDYIHTKSIKSKDFIINKNIILEQIYKNLLIPWDNYIPKIRVQSSKYKIWKKEKKFYDNLKYILIFNKSWISMHDQNCLNWNDRMVKELASLLKHTGIRVIAFDFDTQYYNSGNIISAPLDIEIIIGLMQNCFGILSSDIDLLLVTMALSKSSIIMSRPLNGIYDMNLNAEYLNAQNVMLIDKDLSPMIVYKFLENSL